MGNVLSLSQAQAERFAQNIREALRTLQRKRTLYHLTGVSPARNPSLDSQLTELLRLQSDLSLQIESFACSTEFDERVLSIARAALVDTSEMIRLLIWFGAYCLDDLPLDSVTTGSSWN